jgi:hyperosmotically inducible periplasmic protein
MNSKIAAALVAAALLMPHAAGAADKAAAAKDEPVESSLVTKIKNEFAKDKTVNTTGITVENEEEGIVTLGGRARTKTEADQAIKLARDTSGVISVKNNIVIAENTKESNRGSGGKASSESIKDELKDASITTRIKAEFVKDKAVGAANIKVDTDDRGVVTLSGNAKSQAEAEQAVRIARNTRGVTSVKNEIAVAR